MTVLWTTTELPGHNWDPDPDDEDDDSGPWCRIPGLPPEQRARITDVQPLEEYL